jgi:hypothetical protein
MIFVMITGHPPFDYDEEADMDDNARHRLDQKIVNDEVEFPEGVTGCHIDCYGAFDEESKKND